MSSNATTPQAMSTALPANAFTVNHSFSSSSVRSVGTP